ncbi:exodeoxyribonuclease VII small subunit [Terripilifer ovatus]|uniref:exodeoxyribonuclease VII small subunit n=1 Tax=Terripilifer ovatus TaxID=3032367 RepID=UPI003AB91992
MASTADDLAKLPFEEALKELETIVSQLEGGQVALDKSIELYERGEKLKVHCETLLKSAEARIEKISLAADGKPKGTEPLDE